MWSNARDRALRDRAAEVIPGGMYGHPDPEVVHRTEPGALQLVTHSADTKSWPDGLPTDLADIVGETHIEVSADGTTYLLNGRRMPSWSDQDESEGADVTPSRTPQ